MIRLTYWQLFKVRFYQWRLRSLESAIMNLRIRTSALFDGTEWMQKAVANLDNAYLAVSHRIGELTITEDCEEKK